MLNYTSAAVLLDLGGFFKSLTDEEIHWIDYSSHPYADHIRRLAMYVVSNLENLDIQHQLIDAIERLRQEVLFEDPKVTIYVRSVAGNKMIVAADRLDIWEYDQNHCIAQWRNVLFVVWRGRNTLANFYEEAYPIMRSLNVHYPRSATMLVIVEKDSDLPSKQARQEILGAAKEYTRFFCSCAMIIEKQFNRLSLVRRFADATTRLATLNNVPSAFMKNPREAFLFLQKNLPNKFYFNVYQGQRTLEELRKFLLYSELSNRHLSQWQPGPNV